MWIPTNYKGKSGSKDREDSVFKYIKKKKGPKGLPSSFKGFTEIKKIK